MLCSHVPCLLKCARISPSERRKKSERCGFNPACVFIEYISQWSVVGWALLDSVTLCYSWETSSVKFETPQLSKLVLCSSEYQQLNLFSNLGTNTQSQGTRLCLSTCLHLSWWQEHKQHIFKLWDVHSSWSAYCCGILTLDSLPKCL